MLTTIRQRLTYANVMATIAVFCALGGGAYAAVKLPKNSVGTKQIKKGAVTNAKLGKNSVTGKNVKDGSLTGSDINLATLPKVGSASNADNASHASNADHATAADNATHAGTADNATHASMADDVAPPEAWHEVGAAGEPPFLGGTTNFGPVGLGNSQAETVGFFKDRSGVVHLKGMAKTADSGTGAGAIFNLPAGYRPGNTKILFFSPFCAATGAGTCQGSDTTQMLVFGGGITGVTLPSGLTADGLIIGTTGVTISLDGITFRAAG